MVDPNRNLSKEQLAFLRECEVEFKDRYTEADPEYRAVVTQAEDPPIIHPWKQNKRQRPFQHFNRGGGGYNNYNNRNGSGHGQGYK